VGHPHAQRGLADPRRAGHHHHRRAVVVRLEQPGEPGHLVVATDEAAGAGGELVDRQVVALCQDFTVRAPEVLTRLDAQLGAQPRAHGAEGVDRVAGAVGPVKSKDELRPQRLVPRVVLGQLDQFRDDLRVPSEVEVDPHPPLHCPQPLLAELRHDLPLQRLRRHVGQSRPAPAGQCLVEVAGPLAWIMGPFGALLCRDEPAEVELVLLELEHVALGPGPDQVGQAEQPPHPRHVHVDGLARRTRRVLSPQPFNELPEGDGGIGVRQQRREHHPQLR
jgi:hypothetical protein